MPINNEILISVLLIRLVSCNGRKKTILTEIGLPLIFQKGEVQYRFRYLRSPLHM